MSPSPPPTGLRRRREAANLSREALAAKAGGLASITIRRFERGEGQPHRSTVSALAHALDCTPDQLLLNDDGDASHAPVGKANPDGRHEF